MQITISADVLRALADAEAARAEKLGSSASSEELQTRIADSIERIVEQVGAGWPSGPAGAGWWVLAPASVVAAGQVWCSRVLVPGPSRPGCLKARL